jgi:hypothetical protein
MRFNDDLRVISWCFYMALGVIYMGIPSDTPEGFTDILIVNRGLTIKNSDSMMKTENGNPSVNFNKCGTPKMKPWENDLEMVG